MPELCEDLLSSVDQPLKIARDKQTGKDYLLCDYNRDGDSYRYSVDRSFKQYNILLVPVLRTSCNDGCRWWLMRDLNKIN